MPEPIPTRQIEILIVEGNPAEVLLISEAFKAAGITSGLYATTDLKDALLYLIYARQQAFCRS